MGLHEQESMSRRERVSKPERRLHWRMHQHRRKLLLRLQWGFGVGARRENLCLANVGMPCHGAAYTCRGNCRADIASHIRYRSSRYTIEIYILKHLSKRWCTILHTTDISNTTLHFTCRVKMFKKNSEKSGAARMAEKMKNLYFFETTGRN